MPAKAARRAGKQATAIPRTLAVAMKVLAFTTVYPNPAQPMHGLFVQERVKHAALELRRQHGLDSEVEVVAPVAWRLRLGSRLRGGAPAVPRVEVREGLTVRHPTYLYVPRFLKALDGVLLFLSALLCVWRLRRRFDFDLIDAHFGYPDGFAAVLLGKLFRRPVVITLRGTEPLVARDPRRRRALEHALTRADALVAVAHPLARDARSLGARDCEVIANGVDTARFRMEPSDDARARIGVPLERKLVVSVGHLSPRKGFQRVIAALPEVARAHPEVHFAVVGGPGAEGNNLAELRAQVRALGLEGRVTFAGARPPAEVASWLAAADAFVLASDHEGCPNAVWEALACGLPVVATRVGEVDRMVPRFAGLLVERADDIPALAEALVAILSRPWAPAAIRAHAERHGWPLVAARVVSLWSAVVAAAPRVAGASTAAVGGLVP
jgi:glycosyltransferase involved in cell wall biosynthesis